MNRYLIALAGMVAPFLYAATAAAETSAQMAAAFGARQSVEDVSISPGGKMVAYLTPLQGQGSALYVAPVDGSEEAKPVLVANGDPDRCSARARARV